jgi:hypothetical protein
LILKHGLTYHLPMEQITEQTTDDFSQEIRDDLQRIYADLLKSREGMVAVFTRHGASESIVDSAILGVMSELHALMRKEQTNLNAGSTVSFNDQAQPLADALVRDFLTLNPQTGAPPAGRERAVKS